jgi:signal transduction histidine kinase
MASWQLSQPIEHIRGYVSALREVTVKQDAKEAVEQIDFHVDELDGYVSNILDTQRLEQNEMSFQYQRIRPDVIVEAVVEGFRRRAEGKGLELRCNIKDTARLTLDPRRFKQALCTLLDNAIRYTDMGLVMLKQELSDDRLEIRVHDTGRGMSVEDEQRVFQKFSRAGSRDEQRQVPGIGLGLWVVKCIVEEMGGTITVESTEGRGTDIILAFPVEEDE